MAFSLLSPAKCRDCLTGPIAILRQLNRVDVLQKSADNYEPRGRLDPIGFERHVSFLTYLPPADLAPFIEHFWTIRWDKADNTYNSEHPQRDANIELINEIITAIATDESLQTVTAVAKAFGRSERWLQQLLRDYVGIGLKWLLQRHKLLAVAQQIRESDQPNWATIAYDLGYSSQQHFITAFKQVLGKTPLQYNKELTEL